MSISTSSPRARGLSPRLRGNPSPAIRISAARGSIPASAGEPFSASSRRRRKRVYPRVCGGNQQSGPFLGCGIGSIPASAGEPTVTGEEAASVRVYPRVCGGTSKLRLDPKDFRGLSPRLRGNLAERQRLALRKGSIPASAGEPIAQRAMMSSIRVYPRVCGGTCRLYAKTKWKWGLSPRLRGNRSAIRSRQSGGRSIPASAGEPCLSCRTTTAPGVYPRVCGGTSGF